MTRKDQTNKKKLSLLTNHQNTKSGIIKDGFDRVNLFQQTEQGFDGLFEYNRQQAESFDYHNMVKNCSISQQLKLQEQEFQASERKMETNLGSNQENLFSTNFENNKISPQVFNVDTHITTKQESNTSVNLLLHQKEMK